MFCAILVLQAKQFPRGKHAFSAQLHVVSAVPFGHMGNGMLEYVVSIFNLSAHTCVPKENSSVDKTRWGDVVGDGGSGNG